MTQQLSRSIIEILNESEGVPSAQEANEPASPLKTTIVPAISGSTEDLPPTGETGMMTTVDVAEGKDDDDKQDASLTTDETRKAPEADIRPTTQEKPKVLIVEDTMELAEVIQATLEGMNLQAEHASQGGKAIEKLKIMRPDVVLLDIGLPDMIGWKILDTIKELYTDPSAGKKPIVIIITAYGDPANRLVAKLQGIYSYLIKPFTPDEVESVVSSALSGTR